MLKIFFDTEFSDLSLDPRLVSIGLVSECGREFYAELSDTYQVNECGAFTREVVVPLLQGGAACMTMAELALRLGGWIESFEQPVTLATDSVSWDWPWVQELFCLPGTWPVNLDGHPFLLSINYINEMDIFNAAVEKAFAGGLRRHHALDDAKSNRLGWLASEGKSLGDSNDSVSRL